MLVQEIMSKNLRTATCDTSIREVAMTMCFNKISGLPVIDGNNKIVGIISEKDILHAMYPDVNEYIEGGRIDFESLEHEYKDVINLKVQDIMTKSVLTVRATDPALRAVSIMCVNRIRRIPVTDDRGQLVGILSMGDVHKAIFQEALMGDKSPVQETKISLLAGGAMDA